MALDT